MSHHPVDLGELEKWSGFRFTTPELADIYASTIRNARIWRSSSSSRIAQDSSWFSLPFPSVCFRLSIMAEQVAAQAKRATRKADQAAQLRNVRTRLDDLETWLNAMDVRVAQYELRLSFLEASLKVMLRAPSCRHHVSSSLTESGRTRGREGREQCERQRQK